MNVYVETNFVLELARQQEEFEFCQHILALHEQQAVNLILPAYSLVEPYETLIRHNRERRLLAERVSSELKQLGRSKPYQTEVSIHQTITDLLTRSGDEELNRLNDIRDRLLQLVEIIPLTPDILAASIQLQNLQALSPQDAVVYASVLEHLAVNSGTKSCFLNRNAKDFADVDIIKQLDMLNCKILFSFNQGYAYISSQIR